MSQFTKKAIVETFIKLLNLVPLDKITVKDIVNECGINRNTFYYYFHDIFDLLDYIFKLEAQKVIGEIENYDTWQEGFLLSTKFALENKKMINHVYNSLSREWLESYLYNISDSLMMGYINSQAEGIYASDEDKKFIAGFYKFAMVGMTLEWINKGMKEEPNIIIYKLRKLFKGDIKSALLKSDPRNNINS